MIVTDLNKKNLAVSLIIPLAVGGLASWINYGGISAFESINKPPFSPPQVLFPIVWTLLYLLMGISSYLVYSGSKEGRKTALIFYALQLAANFIWTFVFFGLSAYSAAFIVLLVLLALTAGMIITFLPLSKAAAYLQIPYFIWLCFAGVLNYYICLLN